MVFTVSINPWKNSTFPLAVKLHTMKMLCFLPRVRLANLKLNTDSRKQEQCPRNQTRGGKCGRGHRGETQRGTRSWLGFEGGQTSVLHLNPKIQISWRHQYQPLSLWRLQYLSVLGWFDPRQPIDLPCKLERCDYPTT